MKRVEGLLVFFLISAILFLSFVTAENHFEDCGEFNCADLEIADGGTTGAIISGNVFLDYCNRR